MPDNAGRFISNDQVLSFVKTLSDKDEIEPGGSEEIIIQGAEEALETELGRDLTRQVYTDEQHILRSGTRWDGFIVNPVEYIRLKNYPMDLAEPISVRLIHSRDEDGKILEFTELEKNRYIVKENAGIIRLYSSSFQVFDASLSYLSRYAGHRSIGPYELLCTYTAGYYTLADPAPDDVTPTREQLFPAQLKLFLLQYIARMHRMTVEGYWSLQQIKGELGSDMILRVPLTPEERRLINKFKRPALG